MISMHSRRKCPGTVYDVEFRPKIDEKREMCSIFYPKWETKNFSSNEFRSMHGAVFGRCHCCRCRLFRIALPCSSDSSHLDHAQHSFVHTIQIRWVVLSTLMAKSVFFPHHFVSLNHFHYIYSTAVVIACARLCCLHGAEYAFTFVLYIFYCSFRLASVYSVVLWEFSLRQRTSMRVREQFFVVACAMQQMRFMCNFWVCVWKRELTDLVKIFKHRLKYRRFSHIHFYFPLLNDRRWLVALYWGHRCQCSSIRGVMLKFCVKCRRLLLHRHEFRRRQPCQNGMLTAQYFKSTEFP